MADDGERPLLNPVLRLKMDATPETQRGGGKGRGSIKTERLKRQQQVLAAAIGGLYQSRASLPSYGGRTHILVRMFEDSLAPSHAPDDLFNPVNGCQLVAPFRHGYIVEAELSALPRLTDAIANPLNYAVQSDISRVESVSRFTAEERLRHQSIEELWNAAPADDGGRLFVVWFAPLRNRDAQEDLLRQVENLAARNVFLPTYTAVRLIQGPDSEPIAGAVTTPRQSSIARAMRGYRNTGVARAAIRVPNRAALTELVASGSSYRIDPVRPIEVAAPGEGLEPLPPLITADMPIVGVVDGGLHAPSYTAAEAWRAPPLIPNNLADRRHGNAISSLVVQGYAWNANRPLPPLSCRIGTVQAVPRRGVDRRFDESELIDYLAAVVRAHPETHVWNISANQDGPGLDPDEVSVLGHELNELARAANVLFVVSIGNTGAGSDQRPNPPADCESAIAVGGRRADREGNPADGCPRCRGGPGPDGMLKPDVSWFSQLRMIGGVVETASSYPTPLVSSLAAHTYSNLREPSPDLVKALLINAGERIEHDAKLGWGTPYRGHMPWTCETGSVTLAWRAQLQPGANYYWNDIPIPPEMIRNGKLYGRASLTAILRPLVSPFGGANYFASRLQTSLRYPSNGDWHPLVGSMLESTLQEQEARDELKKWQPVRRHYRDFTGRGGISVEGDHLQLYARVFTRDLYQFGWQHHSQAGQQDVAFVLTLWSGDGQPTVYDSTVRALGAFVESAVVNQDIEIANE